MPFSDRLEPPDRRRAAIYVVDDDPAFARALVRQVEALRYPVVGVAARPDDALREIPATRPDVVLTDLDLRADLDGIGLAGELRRRGDLAAVVFLTGAASIDLTPLRGADGVFAYLRKIELTASLATTLELVATQQATRMRLREMDQRHRSLFEQAAVGVAEIELDSCRFVEINQRGAALLRRTVPDILQCRAADLFAPAALAEAKAVLAQGRHGEVDLEAWCVAGDGAAILLRFDVSPLRLHDGRASHVVAIIQDITARRRAERAVQRSQHLLDQAERISQAGSYALDLQTGKLTWSRGMFALESCEPDSFVPDLTSRMARIHPDDRGAMEHDVALLASGAIASAHRRYRAFTNDGEPRFYDGRGAIEHDEDGAPQLIGSIRDVTAEVLAAAQLRHSEARYRGVFEHAIGGIVRAALDGTIVEANPAFVAILGCVTAGQVVGTTLQSWFADPAVAERLALAAWPPGHALEAELRRQDGGRATVVIDGLVLDDVDGHNFLGFVRDLTGERARVAREREVVEASRAKTAFLAGMSHELRTPLNAVLGLSEALLEGTFGPLADPQVRSLQTVHASGQHLLALINDVLDIARVESGQLLIEPERLRLSAPIEESLALMHGAAARRDQRIVADVAPELPAADIDKRRIKQVLLNLLGNATKFSPPGATIALAARAHPSGATVVIEVIDHGPGIPVADRERVFEPFVTLDASVSREFGGAGLGLTIARRIVALHGGRLWIEDTPGGGSTFVVELPVAQPVDRPATAGTARLGAPAVAAGARPVVLLAEDDAANVMTVQAYLERRGFDVRVVHDGASAVVAAGEPDVAAVLMDVRLPVIDGLEATRRIRAAEQGARRPIIALTAYAMPADEQRCLDAGASTYMSKPVRLAVLAERLAQLIDGGAA
ncbi:MAG: response regulator [Myxococcales bacterium]|nr:response regulator [Myxococcales bacterium]